VTEPYSINNEIMLSTIIFTFFDFLLLYLSYLPSLNSLIIYSHSNYDFLFFYLDNIFNFKFMIISGKAITSKNYVNYKYKIIRLLK